MKNEKNLDWSNLIYLAMKKQSPIQELITYRNKYINRDEKKINREFLDMIDRCLDYMHELEQKNKREEKIHLCYGIDQILLYKVLELPDVVFDKFIDYVDNNKLNIEETEALIYDILYWERRTQDTIDDYHSLLNDKILIAQMLENPEWENDKSFQSLKTIIEKNIENFQIRTRIIISIPYEDEKFSDELEEHRKLILRNKYLNYLFEKYDKRRNRQIT